MSMYVELLTSCLHGALEEVAEDDLVAHAVHCRVEMLARIPGAGTSAYSALATEISYDRALITLCLAHAIAVVPANFDHPSTERTRLEQVLSGLGIDLAALARLQQPA